MSRKQQTKISNPYQLNYRIQKHDGTWGNWQNGTGQFEDMKQVLNQVRLIKMSKPSSSMEIAFIKDGKFLNLDGSEITGPMLFERK